MATSLASRRVTPGGTLRHNGTIRVASLSEQVEPGSTIGPYLIERLLAQGTSSAVYVARSRERDDPERFAIKVLKPDVVTAAARSRFRADAEALSRVGHSGVARVVEWGDLGALPWVASEYVRGVDVKRLLADRGALSPELAVQYAVQAAEALVEVHAVGVVHRDLKPSALVVSPDGRVVVVDFGVVRRRVESPVDVAYLAPEQLEHGLADDRSDVWSLGCVLWEMLTLAPPFGSSGADTVAAILEVDPVFPPSVPSTLVSILSACLRKSSFARVGSARELVSMLRDAHVEARTKRQSMRPSTPPPASGSHVAARPSSMDPLRAAAPVEHRSPSTAMRAAPARGRIKGAALRAGLVWFADLYGEPGLTRVYELASPELAAQLRKDDVALGIIASGWYETHVVGELLELLERVASPADPHEFGIKVAKAIADDNVNGVYRALFRLVSSPQMLAANGQRVWRTYVDEGSLSVTLQGAGQFEARVRGWSRHHPGVCRMIRAMIESLLRAVGYQGLVVERTACVDEGAAACTFQGHWLPR